MIHCLSYDVYNNNIDVDFLNKAEVVKQNRKSVMNRENVEFFKSVIEKFLEFKLRTMAIVYEKKPRVLVWELILVIYFVILNDLIW